MADRQTISACLITKNEAVRIADCFSSLAGRVDEIIVVDTGSTDETVDMAAKAGATVLHQPWNDDFSTPRNLGLDAAASDWILYIDADERLEAPGTGSIANLLPGKHACAARLKLQPSVGSTDYAELRLFRNDPRIRFEQIMHERVVDCIRRVCEADGTEVALALDVRLRHVGYEGNQDHKHARNLPMLLKAIERNPERVYCRFHLGVTLEAIGHREEAITSLNQALAMAREGNTREELKIAAMCSQALAGIAMNMQNPTKALRISERGLEQQPANPALRWCRARALIELQQPDEAIEILLSIVMIDPEEFFDPDTSFQKSIFRQDSYGLLGSAYFMMNRFTDAEKYFQLAADHSQGELEYVSKAALCRARSTAAKTA